MHRWSSKPTVIIGGKVKSSVDAISSGQVNQIGSANSGQLWNEWNDEFYRTPDLKEAICQSKIIENAEEDSIS